jgi:hypothetical protein
MPRTEAAVAERPYGCAPYRPLVEGAARDAAGLALLQLQAGERLLAGELHLALGEGRAGHRVAEELHGERRVVAQHRARDAQVVAAREPAERAAGAFDRGRDLVGRAGAGALGHERRHHVGQPLLAGGRVGVAGRDGEAEGHHWVAVVLDQHDAHAVAERGFLERRERGRAEGRRRRGTGGELRGRAGRGAASIASAPSATPAGRGVKARKAHGLGASAAGGVMSVTTLFAGTRYFWATRCTSAAVTAA